MKLSVLLKVLAEIQAERGDIDIQMQSDPAPRSEEVGLVISTPEFFVVPEEYNDGWRVNLRTWPY